MKRLHDYLERSFLPGRRFATPQDFNSQLTAFFNSGQLSAASCLGQSPAGSARRGPAGDAGLAAGPAGNRLAAAAAVAPGSYLRLGGKDYSVHPAAIGRRVVVSADLDRVRVTCDGPLVADHERIWSKHQTISDPKHLAAAKVLRRGWIDLVRPPVQTGAKQPGLN